jgi:hypothetical protein
MTSTQPQPALASGLSAVDERSLALLADGVAGLQSMGGRSLAEKVEVLRRVEVVRRQWATLDHALINDIDAAELHSLCVPDAVALLVRELHVSPGEAKARVQAAADLGFRRDLTGETVAPVFGSVAAAQAIGSISVEHAAVIRRAVDGLPDVIEAEHGDRFQAELVAAAARVNPVELAKIAIQAATAIDPDTGLSDAEIERRRDTSLVQRRDGMFALRGVLTPECGAMWQVVFDSLAGPAPSVDGVPDPRTSGQRRHDALREVPALLLRAEVLPATGGLIATMIVTVTADQVESGAGYASTSHGDLVPVRRVLDLAIGGQIMPVLFDPSGGILDYGPTRRLAPPGMRLALYARDQGCTFPECDRPPQWSEAHHCWEWAAGGPTSIDNLTLVCGYHHRSFAQAGWRAQIIDGVAHWIPPAAIDPTRTPRRNRRHHLTRAA